MVQYGTTKVSEQRYDSKRHKSSMMDKKQENTSSDEEEIEVIDLAEEIRTGKARIVTNDSTGDKSPKFKAQSRPREPFSTATDRPPEFKPESHHHWTYETDEPYRPEAKSPPRRRHELPSDTDEPYPRETRQRQHHSKRPSGYSSSDLPRSSTEPMSYTSSHTAPSPAPSSSYRHVNSWYASRVGCGSPHTARYGPPPPPSSSREPYPGRHSSTYYDKKYYGRSKDPRFDDSGRRDR